MNNFQLYRTNLYLGGQMKWDIVIDSANAELYVSDFHLSPISKNITYTHKLDENLINNSHQNNVKNYFKKLRSNFYNEAIDSKFNNNWPIICKENDIIDCYSNTYDMGCKRMQSYKLYNKQFEFFCPVWIEKLNGDIKFEIIAKDLDSDTVLSRKSLILNHKGLSYHDNFVSYFKNYVDDAGLNIGCDDLINIKFNNSSAFITGLNVDNGLFTTKEINSLTANMLLRERPLMDVDKMIIESFSENNIISKQLFNFNLCFNISDILSGSVIQLLNGKNTSITINVYIGDEILSKKDFYTEYEFIPKNIITSDASKYDEKLNVLDYLHDYESIDLINKNKLCQNIIHWSLADENDYIFNVYNGFSGIYIDKILNNNEEQIIYHENEHQYKNASNTFIKRADKSKNSTGWINTMKISYWNEFLKFISNTEKMKIKGIHIFDKLCINNIKYANVPKIGENGFYAIGLYVSSNIFTTIKDSKHNFEFSYYLELNNDLIILGKDDLMMIISRDENKLAFSNLKDILYSYFKSDRDITDKAIMYTYAMLSLMLSKIDPELIFFSGTIVWNSTNGPNKKINEIEYYNDNDSKEYLFRYDGKIKPTFVDKNDKLYYKDYISDENNSKLNNSIYSTYINTGFEPLYPSIEYFAIKNITDWNYDKLPMIKVSEHNYLVPLCSTFEYSWFNVNKQIILDPEINFTYINTRINGEYKSTIDIVKEYLQKYYKIYDVSTINYIFNLYDIFNNWDYYSDTNIDDYKYNLTLKLK